MYMLVEYLDSLVSEKSCLCLSDTEKYLQDDSLVHKMSLCVCFFIVSFFVSFSQSGFLFNTIVI